MKNNFAKFVKSITDEIGSANVLTDPAACEAYSADNSSNHALPPAVIFPLAHDQVQKVIALCHHYQIPLTTRGRGTGTTGAAVPLNNSIVLALERMTKIIRMEPENRIITVETGILNSAVQQAAGKHGFFWPPDPASSEICSVGGNLGCNAAGPHALKYGTTRENTLRLRAVTGDGRSITTGAYTTKGAVGYDLTRLLIGSEGTLAVITEATLKLLPLPEAVTTLQAHYSDIATAVQAVTAIMTQPMIPAALEFIDEQTVELMRRYAHADIPLGSKAILLIEVDGPKHALPEICKHIQSAAKNEGLITFQIPQSPEEAKSYWKIRKGLSPALRQIAPKKINEDVVVPVSRLPELIKSVMQLAERYQLTIVNFGHGGNGNIHVNIMLDPQDPTQLRNSKECLKALFDLVLALDGTLSGEHGIGIEKRDFMTKAIDANSLELMWQIKRQFDPNGILNPGKLLPSISEVEKPSHI